MTMAASRAKGSVEYADVGAVADFTVGRLHPVDLPGKDVWVLRTPQDRFYAIKNSCPHQGAPICLGDVDGAFRPSEPGVFEFGMEYQVIRCPYHGYEYDLETGEPAFVQGPKERVVRYDALVRDGRVLVSLKGK